MTGGWAATNTLREFVECPYVDAVDPGMHSGCRYCAEREDRGVLPALALVEAVLAAAERVDEASAAIPVVVDDVWAACEELHRALRAVRESK